MRPTETLSHCAREVREGDHGRFLTALFAPAAVREGVFALLALDLELGRISGSVSQPMMGAIRLQWWHDSIDRLYRGSPQGHPVLQSLAGWIGLLPRPALDTLVDAHRLDVAEEPPASMPELLDYARDTGGAVSRLTAHLLLSVPELPPALDALCADLGTAWALVEAARAVPRRAASGNPLLPADLMTQAGLNPRALVDTGARAALRPVMRAIVGEAEARLGAARMDRAAAPRAALPALLPAALADLHIRALKRASYDPFEAPRRLAPGRAQLRLLRKALTQRF